MTRSVPGGEREIDGDAVIVKFGRDPGKYFSSAKAADSSHYNLI